jgi:hypothetical protein
MVENNLKATHKDETSTMTKAVILFCERTRRIKPPVPITDESVSAKAKHIATKLLVEYERNTTIMEAATISKLMINYYLGERFIHIF